MMHNEESRIRRMEQYFDALRKAAENDPAAIHEDAALDEMLHTLTEYYESGQWLHDYELDEKGLIPQDMKRGVLAQDAVYDLLELIKSVLPAAPSQKMRRSEHDRF